MADEVVKGRIFKCENCGSLLSFNPESQKLKCSHCASLFEIPNITKANEIKYTVDSEIAFSSWEETKTCKCRSCGAEFVIPEYDTASNCPFCNTSNVMYTDDIPGLKPNGILPFKVSAEAAHECYEKWLKKKLMAPFDLKKNAKKISARGVYIPVFTFDASTYSTYSIRYGVTHTKTYRSGNKTVTKTYTVWYTDSGSISKDFNDIQIEASKQIEQKEFNKLGGFDTDNSYAYKSDFIAGFASERYAEGLDASFEEAKEIAHDSIERSILSRYVYDTLDYCDIRTTYNNVTYKYVLVPMWVMEYNYKKKTYRCLVNGRTGVCTGKTPVSPVKVGLIAVAAIALIALIVYFYNNM